MTQSVLYAVLVALIVGAGGTGGGALITCFIKTASSKLCAALMGLSGGIVLIMVLMDMVPEAVESAGPYSLIGVAMGALCMLLLIKLVPHKDASEYDDTVITDFNTSGLARSGLLIAMGIAIHNLPQGIAVGSGGVSGSGFGITLSLLLLIHNIPEGMAMAIPLKIGGVSYKRIFTLALLAALPTVIGAVIGSLVANISEIFIGGAVAFAAGAMGFLALKELVPQAIRMHRGFWTALFIIIGAGAGAAIILLLHH